MSDIKKIKGAIFDMDGTLVSSMEAWRTIGVRYLHTFGIKEKPGIYEILHPMTLPEACEYLHNEYGTTAEFPVFLKTLNSLMDDFYKYEVELKNGAKEILDSLKNCNVPMVLATATNRKLAIQCLEHLNINEYFENVFTCDEVGCGKTKPDIFYAALDYLKTPKADTWVFEDALFAVKTAKAEGFPTVAFFDEASDEDQETLKRLSDIYMVNYTDWQKYFA